MIQPFDSLMLRTLLGPLVAALQIFAVYVVVHGHYSPGGGFQGGILLAASLILPWLARGHGPGGGTSGIRAAIGLTAAGVLIFTLVGASSMLVGRPMLDYGALPLAETAAYRRSAGILLIEVGVTLGVAGAMVSIFHGLAGRIGAGAEP